MSHCPHWVDVAVDVWGVALAAFLVTILIAGVTQRVRGKHLHDSPLVPVFGMLWLVCAVGIALAILAPKFLPAYPACLSTVHFVA
jgi:hypothetical protein